MKQFLLINMMFLTLMACQEDAAIETRSEVFVSDTLEVGAGVGLDKPFRVEYDRSNKGSSETGKVYFNEEILYAFRLNFNLIEDSIKADKWMIRDTVTTTLRKDTLVFHWYKRGHEDWITVRYTYTYASGLSSQYAIWGKSEIGNTHAQELSFLFSEIRRAELVDFFEHDSTLIRNIVALEE